MANQDQYLDYSLYYTHIYISHVCKICFSTYMSAINTFVNISNCHSSEISGLLIFLYFNLITPFLILKAVLQSLVIHCIAVLINKKKIRQNLSLILPLSYLLIPNFIQTTHHACKRAASLQHIKLITDHRSMWSF